MTTRKMINREVDELDINGYSIKDAIEILNDILAVHGDKAYISKEDRPYSDSQYFAVFKPVPETDREMNGRLSIEKMQKEAQEKREYEDFKRLSVKFAKEAK